MKKNLKIMEMPEGIYTIRLKEQVKVLDDEWLIGYHSFKFDDIQIDDYKFLLKDYVRFLFEEKDKNKDKTNYNHFKIVKEFILYMIEVGVYKIEYVSKNFFTEFMQDAEGEYQPSTLVKYKVAMINFCYYLAKEIDGRFAQSIKIIQALNYESEIGTTPYKLMDINYFNLLLSKLIKVYKDSKEEIELRKFAALMVIITQTGIRISEAVRLRRDCLENEAIYYESIKSGDGYDDKVTFRTLANNKTRQAVNFLKFYGTDKINLLYQPLDNQNYYLGNNAERILRKKFYEFNVVFNKDLKNIDNKFYQKTMKTKKIVNNRILKEFPELYGKYISYPDIHQFRVFAVTWYSEIYKINLELVREMMGHLNPSMTYGYSRPASMIQQMKRNILFNNYSIELIESLTELLRAKNNGITKKDDDTCPLRQKVNGLCLREEDEECISDINSDEVFVQELIKGKKANEEIIIKNIKRGYYDIASEERKKIDYGTIRQNDNKL